MIILRASYPNYTLLTPNPPLITEDLDVLEADQPILLDISAIENTDIGNVFGVSSQTFSLPGTDTNNQFFGNLFDLGATPNVALQKSVDCQVLSDGQEVFKGKLYITDIVTDQKGYTTYQVNVVNETVDLKFKLENLSMCEIANVIPPHTYTYANITSSWSDGLYAGDVVYPHVDYGIPEENSILPEYALGADSIESRKIDNINYPLQVEQFKPAYRVKTILGGIFGLLDYKYTSSFIDSDYFNNIYVLPTNTDTLGVSNTDPASGSFWAYSSFARSASAFQTLTIDFTDEVYDNANAFNVGTNLFTAYTDGYYNFEVQLEYSIDNFQTFPGNFIEVSLVSGSNAIIANQIFVTPPQANTLLASFNQIYLTEGQTVKVTSEYGSPQTGLTSVINYINTNQNSISFKGTGPTAVLNSDVLTEKQFPCELSALDFLQGLIEKFNWVVEPIPNERNLIRIEPFQDWVDQGATKDWTDKVDRSQKFKISHPILEQPKTIYFRDKDDEAVHNKYTKDNFGETFGTYIRTEDQSDLAQGEREVGSVFAATPVKGVSDTNMIIPTLGKRDNSGQIRPFKFIPRLLYKNGLKTVPLEATGWSDNLFCYEYHIQNRDPVQSSDIDYTDCDGNPQTTTVLADSDIYIYARPTPTRVGPATQVLITQITPASASRFPGTYFFEDENGVIHQESQYLQMTTFEYLPTDASGSISGSRDLHFGNLESPGWYQYFQPVENGKTTRDAYHEYWATYINNLYDIDARKLTCNVFIEPYEIQGIALNDKIFIDGHYYRINDIKGANITHPASVEVTLIKELNRQLKYPRRRIQVGADTPVDLTVDTIDASGRVQYVDYNTGNIVSDYDYVSQAANKDGFIVFADANNSASVSLEPKAVVTSPTTRTVYGANEVDPTADAVMVAGGANTVARQTNNLLVVGEANTLNAGLTNVTTIGKNNTISRSVKDATIVGSNSNTITTGSSDVTIIGGVSHAINSSSLVTMVGGASNTVSDSFTSRNVTIGGLNNVSDNNQDTTIINNNGSTFISGSGHTIIGDVDSINLNEYRNQSNILGPTYHYGNQFFRVVELTISQTGSIDLQSPSYLDVPALKVNFVDDGTGPGHGSIYLPAISGSANQKNMDDRTYTLFTNGSVPTAASKYVRLYPATGDAAGIPATTINGEAYIQTSSPYGAITVIAHAGQWYILSLNNP